MAECGAAAAVDDALQTEQLLVRPGGILVGDDVYGVKPPPWLAGTLPLGELMTYPVYRLFISAVCVALGLAMRKAGDR